ncbi:hypothetical protein [Streptomyces cyaneofuscatus]|uniref:hypothetical protein n=1 Tax=Streptomyces cyaneofuscatus TaxID=66883 RepID=UPI00343D5F38
MTLVALGSTAPPWAPQHTALFGPWIIRVGSGSELPPVLCSVSLVLTQCPPGRVCGGFAGVAQQAPARPDVGALEP